MQLPKELHARVANEFRFVADRMRDTKDPFGKVFLLSAFYGEAGRILNQHWDKDLALIHLVIQQVQQQINARLQLIVSGGERNVKLDNAYFDALTQAADALASYVEHDGNESELCGIVGRFAELSYITTGNGYYLLGKGQIRL
ncbi:MAG: hypothetical protein Q7K03_01560 [Dehalococcoidia bacterium]|nr:hypothetical protein [Dehalococcoidia bacterium]